MQLAKLLAQALCPNVPHRGLRVAVQRSLRCSAAAAGPPAAADSSEPPPPARRRTTGGATKQGASSSRAGGSTRLVKREVAPLPTTVRPVPAFHCDLDKLEELLPPSAAGGGAPAQGASGTRANGRSGLVKKDTAALHPTAEPVPAFHFNMDEMEGMLPPSAESPAAAVSEPLPASKRQKTGMLWSLFAALLILQACARMRMSAPCALV